jgi:hypothetical protein
MIVVYVKIPILMIQRKRLTLLEKWIILHVQYSLNLTANELYKTALTLISPLITKRTISNLFQKRFIQKKHAKEDFLNSNVGKVFIYQYPLTEKTYTLFMAVEKYSGWIFIKKIKNNGESIELFIKALKSSTPFKINKVYVTTRIYNDLKRLDIAKTLSIQVIAMENNTDATNKIDLYNDERGLKKISFHIDVYHNLCSIKSFNYLTPYEFLVKMSEFRPDLVHTKPPKKFKMLNEFEGLDEFDYHDLSSYRVKYSFLTNPYHFDEREQSYTIIDRQRRHLQDSLLTLIFSSLKNNYEFTTLDFIELLNLPNKFSQLKAFFYCGNIVAKDVYRLNSQYGKPAPDLYFPLLMELPKDYLNFYIFRIRLENITVYVFYAVDKKSKQSFIKIKNQSQNVDFEIKSFLDSIIEKINVKIIITDTGREFCHQGLGHDEWQKYKSENEFSCYCAENNIEHHIRYRKEESKITGIKVLRNLNLIFPDLFKIELESSSLYSLNSIIRRALNDTVQKVYLVPKVCKGSGRRWPFYR